MDRFEQSACDHQWNEADREDNRQHVPIGVERLAATCRDADKQKSDEGGNEPDKDKWRKSFFARCFCAVAGRDQCADCGQRSQYRQEKTGEAEDASSHREPLAEADHSQGKQQRSNLKQHRGLIAGREDGARFHYPACTSKGRCKAA